MNFKTNIILMIIMVCLTVIFFTSCSSHEQKGNDAFERVKEERLLSNDSNIINKAMVQEPKDTVLDKKKEIPDMWTQYKTETEKKIHTNENNINEMKALPNVKAGLYRKVTDLEKDNNDLIVKMDEYNKDEKVKRELFKASMNQNVNKIGIQLKEIKINNKK